MATSATLAAAAATGGARAAAPNDKIRFGVIGCRGQGGGVAGSFLESGQFEVVALCDCDEAMIPNAMRSVEKHTDRKPAFYKDFRKMLEDAQVDAIINATPDHWHALITVLALEAGKHVYVEKPASYNIQDGKAMVAAQQRHPGLVVQVGTQQRSAQHFKDAREFIQSGGLGKVGFCRAWISHEREALARVPDTPPPATLDYEMWLGPAPYHPYNENKVHYNWHWVRDFGTGEMGNWGAHWLDICRWAAGVDLPTGVSGHGGQFVTKDIKEWPDTQTVIYEYPEMTMLWEQRLWTRRGALGGSGSEFVGDRGSLTINRGGWTFSPREGDPVRHAGSTPVVTHALNFAQAIRGEAPAIAPIDDGHRSAVLCHLGNIAATLNRRVAFDPASQSVVNDPEAAAMESREYRGPWRLPV